MSSSLSTSSPRWQFWVDRGGTFTDITAIAPNAEVRVMKLLSEAPEHYQDAAVEGIKRLLGDAASQSLSADQIEIIKMGTTVATNALLERKGEPVLLLITQGFADALRIGYQQRPDLFARKIELPEMLYQHAIEVSERLDAQGQVVIPLELDKLQPLLQQAYHQGLRSCAIALMHAYRNPTHELAVAELAARIGFTQISMSHQCSALIKLIGRGDTAVVDSYLSPILRRYVERVAGACRDVKLQFMQSNGGLTDAHRFQGKDAILSGPAGGVVGMVKTAAQAGFDKVIGFDMGGTSTDVSLYCGEYERSDESVVAGVRMRAPMMKVHTVAAGGGSVLGFDGGRITVGPDSAGANPGPVCYRRGGPLAVTDINVLLGRIQPDYFPALFGELGDQPLDSAAVQRAFAQRLAAVDPDGLGGHTVESLAEGYMRIAIDHMAAAIKRISIQRGYDVGEYVLNCFGGAGAQHACQVADALAIPRVFIHRRSGVLSAYGIGMAEVLTIRQQTLEQALSELSAAALASALAPLQQQAEQELVAQGYTPAQMQAQVQVALRYQGSDTALWVAQQSNEQMQRDFEAQHQRLFGFIQPDVDLVVATLQVQMSIAGQAPESGFRQVSASSSVPTPHSLRPVYWQGSWLDTPFYLRQQLAPGMQLSGPLIVVEPETTVVVMPGWCVKVTEADHLLLQREDQQVGKQRYSTARDPILLEVFNNLFMHIAEQMGDALQQTASSVNIKERLDFSCAIFDGQGELVANAPHMPVHLGSMGETVRSALQQNRGDIQPGDVWLINSPYHGGTHLPDLTVITPVFDASQRKLLFVVASRGHHADIGGITPGSMPASSNHIEQEGVLFENFRLVRAGRFDQQGLLAVLAKARYPARNPNNNLADLKAQVAANEKGVTALQQMLTQFSEPVVAAYMGHVQDYAEQCVRAAIRQLQPGSFVLPLDDGSQIAVRITLDQALGEAHIDFTGTSPQQPTNFNAPAAITRAAVLYVFRTLVDEAIPMNAGCLRPIKLTIPPASMLAPDYPAAVVAGNVETSQCITDALYGALGVMASSQGTMNNFTFGDRDYQYYETICGGSGAGLHGDGTSAVQTHMTNSRLTDPEVLELRYPVRVERFAIRRGSGGAGQFFGGDGVERCIRFLKPMQAAILSNRRSEAPFGLAGGSAGLPGQNSLLGADGTLHPLAGCAEITVNQGDAVVISTPGGGGFGSRKPNK